jgi:hypothetical protein
MCKIMYMPPAILYIENRTGGMFHVDTYLWFIRESEN